MPITQARMIAVLNAGNAYKDALNRTKYEGAGLMKELNAGNINAEVAITQLTQLLYMVTPEIETVEALIKETAHFKAMQASNNYEQRRQAERRAKLNGTFTPPRAIDHAKQTTSHNNPMMREFASGTEEEYQAHVRDVLGGGLVKAEAPQEDFMEMARSVTRASQPPPKDPAATMPVAREITEGEELGL